MPGREAAVVVLGIVATVALPTAIVLAVVGAPGSEANFGYTWSLLIFGVPIAIIALWFWRTPNRRIQRRALLWSFFPLILLGFILDYAFAASFLVFEEDSPAVLGVHFDSLHGTPVPIEEYAFYVLGFLFVLLLYIWCDEYWLSRYNRLDYERQKIERLVRFHTPSLWIALALIAAAAAYRNVLADLPAGFPGYFTYLVIAAVVPSVCFFPSIRDFVNWQALAMTAFVTLVISVVWEITLGLPHSWWGYQDAAMLGVFIPAWSNLPVEAVVVWVAVTFTSVTAYEVAKLWKASGLPASRAFFGGHDAAD